MEKPKIKPTISVCLATRNEEGNIDRCLRSVRGWADEIVVVDGESTDNTVSVAKKFKAIIFPTTHKPMFHINKQIAIDRAKGDWILLLDADEEVTQSLQKEISEVINSKFQIPNSKMNGYWIPRKNIIFGQWIEHTGWWPDYQLRLFRKGTVKFPCLSVHEHPQINGETVKLTEPLIHHHYQSISQYLERLNRYTDNDLQALIKEGEKIEWKDALVWPWDEFIKRFIVWEGYKDGRHGLALSLLQAFYRFVVWVKLWEKNRFQPENHPHFDAQVKKIIATKISEYQWWRYENIITRKSNGIKSIWYKIWRRIKT